MCLKRKSFFFARKTFRLSFEEHFVWIWTLGTFVMEKTNFFFIKFLCRYIQLACSIALLLIVSDCIRVLVRIKIVNFIDFLIPSKRIALICLLIAIRVSHFLMTQLSWAKGVVDSSENWIVSNFILSTSFQEWKLLF